MYELYKFKNDDNFLAIFVITQNGWHNLSQLNLSQLKINEKKMSDVENFL